MNAIVSADNHLVIARDMEFSSTSQTQAGMIERSKIPYPNTASDWACYPTYSAVHYYGVHMFSSTDIWLCGEKGTIITTRNQNGGIISGTSAPNPHKEWFGHQTNIYDNLYSITAVNSDIVIAVGQNGKIIKTSNASSVNNLITTCENPISPTFTLVNPVCEGDFLDSLSTLSLENITGTWSPTINNKQTTIYTFTPTIRQCATTTTMKIEVVPIITPIFTEIASICSGNKLAELPLLSNNGINGTWSPGLNNVKTTNYTFTPTKGQCAISSNMTIIVNPTPEIATLSGPSVICIGTSDTLIPSITGGQWASSNSNIATVNNGIIKGTLDGTVDISYTLADGQCSSKTTTTIAINNLPEVATLTGSSVVCLGSSSTLIPSITGGQWTSSNTNIVTVNEGLIQGVLNGTVDISYTLGGNGCSSSVSKAITVETKPALPQISGPSKICWNGKAMMRASVAGGVWGVENSALILSSPQGLFRNSVKPVIDNFKSGVNYTIKSRLGACSSKAVKNVYVRNITAPSISVIAAKTSLKVNEVTTATATTTINSAGTWSSTNTVVGATANLSNTKTAAVKGLRVGTGANVVYFADDLTSGCRQAGYIAFNVTNALNMVSNNQTELTVPVNVSLYPNPSNGKFTIENLNGAKYVKLLDLLGRVIATHSISLGANLIDFSDVAIGKYMVQISGDTINEIHLILIE